MALGERNCYLRHCLYIGIRVYPVPTRLHELRHRATDLTAPDLPIIDGVQLSARHRRDSKALSDHGLLWESLSGLPELSRATYQGELIRWSHPRPAILHTYSSSWALTNWQFYSTV